MQQLTRTVTRKMNEEKQNNHYSFEFALVILSLGGIGEATMGYVGLAEATMGDYPTSTIGEVFQDTICLGGVC